MKRKFLAYASFAVLMVLGTSMGAYPASAQSESNQQSTDAKSVSGKVAAIGSDHKSFSLEVSGGNTMQFVLDEKTQVQGKVSTGTSATVQYQTTQDGKNLALTIAPQGSDQSPQ
jgi:hypothetical protein